MANLDCDLSQTVAFGELPDGVYNVKIIKDELKEYNGQKCLTLTYKVIDGPYKNTYKFEDLKLWHENPEFKRIDRGKLKGIALAIKHPNPNYISNSSELIGGEMTIKLKTTISKTNGKSYQNVTSRSPIKGIDPSAEHNSAMPETFEPQKQEAPKQEAPKEEPQAQPSEAQNDSDFPWSK